MKLKRIRLIMLSFILFGLVALVISDRLLRYQAKRLFDKRYEGAYVANARAIDGESGIALVIAVLTDSPNGSGLIPLNGQTMSYTAFSLRHNWVDRGHRRIYVTAKSYPTNMYDVSGPTNIRTVLVRDVDGQ
jgi:hypothetical protein